MKARDLIEGEEEFSKKELLDMLRPIMVWIAKIGESNTETFYASHSSNGLFSQLAQYVRENWHMIAAERPRPPMRSDRELVHLYFDRRDPDEYLRVEEVPLNDSRMPTVWVAAVRHDRDEEFFAGSTKDGLAGKVAERVRQRWREAPVQELLDQQPPADDQEAIRTYFEHRTDAMLTVQKINLHAY